MASDISRVKVDKLLADNLDAQAAITNVLETTRLIAEAAQADGTSAPLMDASLALYHRAEALGLVARKCTLTPTFAL